jgi:hypothetical protein
MNAPTQSPCSKCPLRRNETLDRGMLEEFITDSLMMSIAHYDLIFNIISDEERLKYELKHLQVKLLLSLFRYAKLSM